MSDVHNITKKCDKCKKNMEIGKDKDGHIFWYCSPCKREVDYEFKCPVCGDNNVSEVTGWCSIYCEPLINGECLTGPDRQMCCNPLCPTHKVEDVFFCESCDKTFFSYDSYIDWNDIMGYVDCPIGSFDIKHIVKRYHECIDDAKKILDLGFGKISLAFIVTSFEIVVKELFVRNYRNWFYYYLDPGEREEDFIKDLILENVSKLNLPSYFNTSLEGFKSKVTILNRENLIEFLREELFSKGNQLKYVMNINFNRMSDSGSFPWLYKNFYRIDVIKEFQKKGDDKWEKFRQFVVKRHRIIHNYSIQVEKKYVEEGEKITSQIVDFLHDQLNSTDEYVKKYLTL